MKFTSNDADGYFGYELVESLNYTKYCDNICDPFPYFMERLRECIEVETNNDWAFLAINALTHHHKACKHMVSLGYVWVLYGFLGHDNPNIKQKALTALIYMICESDDLRQQIFCETSLIEDVAKAIADEAVDLTWFTDFKTTTPVLTIGSGQVD